MNRGPVSASRGGRAWPPCSREKDVGRTRSGYVWILFLSVIYCTLDMAINSLHPEGYMSFHENTCDGEAFRYKEAEPFRMANSLGSWVVVQICGVFLSYFSL